MRRIPALLNTARRAQLEAKRSAMSLVPTYKYISADDLAQMIKASPSSALKDYAVVDVRDDDFVGGNIVTALNYPSNTFHDNVNGLVTKLKDVPTVIFHCALSQARGPKAARIYAEKRNEADAAAATRQEVYVLRDGFSGFQQKFRSDPELVEKFNKYYHD